MKLHQDEFSNYANLPGVTKPYSKNHQQTTDTVEITDEYEKTISKMPEKYQTGSCSKTNLASNGSYITPILYFIFYS